MDSPSELKGKTDYDLHRDSTHADSYREWDQKIMDNDEPVIDIEEYITARSDAEFSHGICKDCAKKLYPDFDYDKER